MSSGRNRSPEEVRPLGDAPARPSCLTGGWSRESPSSWNASHQPTGRDTFRGAVSLLPTPPRCSRSITHCREPSTSCWARTSVSARPLEAMVADGSTEEFARTQALAEAALLNQGVTFCVYSDSRGVEKIFPVCLLPRIISAAEWTRARAGAAAAGAGPRGLRRGRLRRSAHPRGRAPSRARWCSARRSTCPRCAASGRRPGFASTSPASTSSATAPACSGCSRTTSARPRASPTCWRTGSSRSGSSRGPSRPPGSGQ